MSSGNSMSHTAVKRINPFGLRWRITSGLFWVLVSSLIGQGAGFLRAVLPARLLGIETYGEFVSIQNILAFFSGFAGLGLGTTATRYVSQLRHNDPTRAGRILWLCRILTLAAGIIGALLLILLTPIIVDKTLNGMDLGLELGVGAVYVLFFTLNTYQNGALVGFESFSKHAWLTTKQSMAYKGLNVCFILLLGLFGAIIGLCSSAVFTWGLQGIVLRNECRRMDICVTCSGASQELGIFPKFALPAGISGMIGGIVIAGGNAILVRHANGFAEVAIFNVAITIRTIALFLPGLLTKVTLPVLSNLQGLGDVASYRKTFGSSFWASTSFAVGSAIILFLSAPFLLYFFGKEYSIGSMLVTILLLSAVFEVISASFFQVLYSHGYIWSHLVIVVLWAGMILFGGWLFVPHHGAVGLAFLYLIAWLVSTMFYAIVARKILSSQRN